MLKLSLTALAALFLVAGCAAGPRDGVVPSDHPANPSAASAPTSPPSRVLAVDSAGGPRSAPDGATDTEPADHSSHGGGMMHHHHGAAAVSAPTTQGADGQAAVYVCPMHPEVVSDKPGHCPKCGMTLVRKGGTR